MLTRSCKRETWGVRDLEHHRFHVLVWHFLRLLLRSWMRRKFRYAFAPVDTAGPCLVVANHVTDWDPLLVGCAFPRQMYFVASEHIFRWGFRSRLIRWLLNPIPRLKGCTATDTAFAILRRLKHGASVCLFAEGNRCWDGLTEPIHATTGRLVRASGATLVTFRLEGGYLTSPRWAGKNLRRGQMQGRVAGVYAPAELRVMPPEEITRLIERDLREDAWARQREEPVAYRGENLAEHLERLLCLCPACRRVGKLHSAGDYVRCDCGLTARYTEYGYFDGDALPYDNLLDWTRWQDTELCALFDAHARGPFLTDTNITLSEILPGHEKQDFGTGTLSLYHDRLTWDNMVLPFPAVTGVSLLSSQTMELGFGRKHFEFGSGKVRCLRKYMTLLQYAKSQPRRPGDVIAAGR